MSLFSFVFRYCHVDDPSMSSDLQWQLLFRSNKFVQKRNGIRLSSDPFNNSGKYTKRQSGFAADKAAVLKLKGEKQIYATLKNGENANKPRKMFEKKVFAAGVKASEVAKAVGAVRADLVDTTFRRARKLAGVAKRIAKVRKARKELSATKKFKRTNTQKKNKK